MRRWSWPRRAVPICSYSDLLVQRMLKAIAPPAGAIRPDRQPGVVDKVVLRRQPFTLRLDIRHGALRPAATAAAANARPTTLAPSSTRRAAGGRASMRRSQQLPQPLRQTRHLGLGRLRSVHCPSRRTTQSLLHQMLHHVHHEQRIAVRALRRRTRPVGPRPARPAAQPHTPPHPRPAGTPGAGPPLPPPTQLLDHAPQRMRPQHRLHRAIRPQHQQPRRLPPLGQVGQELDRGVVTPVQVFEHQHQRRVGRQHVERLGEFAQHARLRRALHLALHPLQLRRRSPARGVAPATSAHTAAAPPGAPAPLARGSAAPTLLTRAGTVPLPHSARRIGPARSTPRSRRPGGPTTGPPPSSCQSPLRH